jgi:uncharacterized membrane protein YqiK
MDIIWTILAFIGIAIVVVLGLSFLILVFAAVELMKDDRNNDITWRR